MDPLRHQSTSPRMPFVEDSVVNTKSLAGPASATLDSLQFVISFLLLLPDGRTDGVHQHVGKRPESRKVSSLVSSRRKNVSILINHPDLRHSQLLPWKPNNMTRPKTLITSELY